MPAHSQDFPWPSYYGNYYFFETRMRAHNCVTNIEPLGNGLYTVTRDAGQPLQVFICECYSFGVAEYFESIEKLGPLDAVIINSNWCGYTYEAKRLCREQKVGLLKIGDFMAALNRQEFWTYLDEYETEYFKEQGWL